MIYNLKQFCKLRNTILRAKDLPLTNITANTKITRESLSLTISEL